MKSTETKGSLTVDKIFFKSFFDELIHILLISFSDVSLEALKTKSIKLTFGVGTLIAVPSSFQSKDGITNPIAFAAPVFVGIKDVAADLARLKSLL